MISSYILLLLFTTTSVCHALYLQSSVLSTPSLTYSLQKKHLLRYATYHHPSTTASSILLAISNTIHHHPIHHRFASRRCNTILNNALNINNEQQQIENDDESEEEHLVGIGVGIDLGTTNSAIAMMIPSTTVDDIVDSEDIDGSRYVHSYVGLSHSLTYRSNS